MKRMSMATMVAQPCRRVLNESDMYRELPPPPPIAAHVMCLWTREGPAAGRVLPDGCADIVWTGERLLVAGPATRSVVPQVSADATKVGIRFRTGAAAQALGLPARGDLGRAWARAGGARGGRAEHAGAAAFALVRRRRRACARSARPRRGARAGRPSGTRRRAVRVALHLGAAAAAPDRA